MPDPKTPYTKDFATTVRGVQGGYLWVAPKDTPVPTGCTPAMSAMAGFNCIGYVVEDGITETLDASSDPLKDLNGDTIAMSNASTTETITATLVSVSEGSLGVQYGSKNITSGADGSIEVDHNWSNADEEYAVVLDLLLKDGLPLRKVIPASKVTERGDVTFSGSELLGREITLTYLSDENGSTCKDYYGVKAGGETE